MLFHHATELPVRFFVTSRPEPAISDKMLSQNNHARSVFILHEIEKSVVQADIETYLSSELACISPPPSADQIRRLAEQSGNLFIYAATALRYICPDDAIIDSRERLATVLETMPTPHSKKYEEIDSLYTAILAAVLKNSRLEPVDVDNIRGMLHSVICVMEPLTTVALATLLELNSAHKAHIALKPLRSVIHISEGSGLVSPLHASFPDYLLSSERSGEFFCDPAKQNSILAERCFKIMKLTLRFNICGLESSFVFDRDIPGLSDRVDQAVSTCLFYACRYWGEHLVRAGPATDLIASLKYFLSRHILFWMEVLNLKGCMSTGALLLSKVYRWLQVCILFLNNYCSALTLCHRFVMCQTISFESPKTRENS
jgi:hypothetical protein